MNKFDQTILEYTGTLPPINPEEVVKRLAPALKSSPQVAKVMSGVGGAIENAAQPDPKVAEILSKLNDPKSQFSSDEIKTLGGFLNQRGFEFKPMENQTMDQNKEPEAEQETETTGSVEEPTSYGVQDRKLQGV
jgi:hypothetical protein